MDWLVGILLLLVGVVIGYFVAKLVNERNLLSNDDVSKEQTIKELMSQQAANHIQETKQIAQILSQQAAALEQQLEAYEQLTNALDTSENGPSLSYFGEHATAYLRHNKVAPSKEKTTTEFQPLDFASQGSGLFSGEEHKNIKQVK